MPGGTRAPRGRTELERTGSATLVPRVRSSSRRGRLPRAQTHRPAGVRSAHQNDAPPEPALEPPELPLEPLPRPEPDVDDPLDTTTAVHLPHLSVMLPLTLPRALSYANQ